jgi:hypothetical protein
LQECKPFPHGSKPLLEHKYPLLQRRQPSKPAKQSLRSDFLVFAEAVRPTCMEPTPTRLEPHPDAIERIVAVLHWKDGRGMANSRLGVCDHCPHDHPHSVSRSGKTFFQLRICWIGPFAPSPAGGRAVGHGED